MCCLLCEPEKVTLLGGSGSPAGDTGLGEQNASWLPAPPVPQTAALLQVKLHNQGRVPPASLPLIQPQPRRAEPIPTCKAGLHPDPNQVLSMDLGPPNPPG